MTFSGVGNDLRVTFDTAGVNTDSVSQLRIDRAQVEKGTATKVSDGVDSLKAYSASEDGTVQLRLTQLITDGTTHQPVTIPMKLLP